MNPLFMQMMMNSMGMGCPPMFGGMSFMMPSMCCGSGFMMSMPTYQNDNLWFLNQPIYRDTSYDYLLDPNLALRRCQEQWRNGGVFPGSTMLPGFTFPGVSQFPGIPGMPGVAQPPAKTEAQKKAEKRKEDEKAHPKSAEKFQNMKKSFEQIKKLAEDKNNKLQEISEEAIKKVKEAEEAETVEEGLRLMKEAFALVPQNDLRKSVLADSEVKKQLRAAGYNFDLGNNKYSLKNTDIKEQDADSKVNIVAMEEDIRNASYNKLPHIAGLVAKSDDAKSKILSIYSAWNSKYNTSEKRGIIRYVAAHIPTDSKIVSAQLATIQLAEALKVKASEYAGSAKIDAAVANVSKKIETIAHVDTDNLEQIKAKFTKTNLIQLADACDELYARLRMQEAVKVNKYLNNNFQYINELKPNTINSQTIIEETQKDLQAEGVAFPALEDLDEAPITEDIVAAQEEESKDIDEQYADDGKGKIEALANTIGIDGKNKILTKVEGKQNVYQTKAVNPSGKVRYFAVDKENKVIEVYKKDNKFVRVQNDKEVSAADITNYDTAVTRANNLYKNKAFEAVEITGSKYPIFKATGADELYIIKDNKLVHLVGASGITSKTVDGKTEVFVTLKDNERKEVSINALTEDDVEEFDDADVRTKKQVEEEKKAKAIADVTSVESHTYASVNDLENNSILDELSKEATGKAGNFEKTKVAGYFFCKGKNRYYKFDTKTGKLVYQPDIKSINENGYITKKNGKCEPIAEVFMDKVYTGVDLINKIQEYGSEFRTHLNGNTSDEEYVQAHKKLNTIIAMNNPVYTINFIKGYKNNSCLWSNNGICKQIVTENGIDDGDAAHILKGKYYLKKIAELMKKVVETTGFDRNSDDYKTLCKIANGELISKKVRGGDFCVRTSSTVTTTKSTAEKLDAIIDKIIESYDKKYSAS